MPNTIKPGQRIPGPDYLKGLKETDIARVGDDIYRRDLSLEQQAMKTYHAAPQTEDEWAAFRQSVYAPAPEPETKAPPGEEEIPLDQREQARSVNTAQEMREDRAEQTPTDSDELRRQKENLQADYIKDLEAEREKTQQTVEDTRKSIQSERESFQQEMAPIREDALSFARDQVNAIKQIDAEANIARLNQLQETLAGYHSAMNDELDILSGKAIPLSTQQGLQRRAVSNYQSKIATANAEAELIKGNTMFAFDVIDRSSQSIKNTLQTEKDFFNMVYEMETAEMALEFEEFGLSDEEKTQIEGLISDIDKDIARIDANKEAVWSLLESNPKMVNEAGITLTDTEEEIFNKTVRWFAKNPMEQSGPSDWKKTTFNDKDALFSPSTGEVVYVDGSTDPITGVATEASKVLSGAKHTYNFTSYATDPEWGHKMKKHLSDVHGMYTAEQINKYIAQTYPASILKGQGDAIINVANEYDIDPTIMLALLKHESYLGASNVAKNNNNFGGITWNSNFPEEMRGTARPSSEGGHYVKFNSVEEGLAYQAAHIARRKMAPEEQPKTKYEAAQKVYDEFSGNVGTRTELASVIKENIEGWTQTQINNFVDEETRNEMETTLSSVVGPDDYVSPDDWGHFRDQWIRFGNDGKDFDNFFAEYRNPENPYYQVEAERSEIEAPKIHSPEWWEDVKRYDIEEQGKSISTVIQTEIKEGTQPGILIDGLGRLGLSSGEEIYNLLESSLRPNEWSWVLEELERKAEKANVSGWRKKTKVENYIESLIQ